MTDLKTLLNNLNNDYNQANADKKTGSYWKLSLTVSDFEATLREHVQHITHNEIAGIIKKLKLNSELTKEELKFVKLWIVGDAEHYVRLENNFQDWLDELDRLMDEIKKYDVDKPDYVAASGLRAILLDALRVLGDITFYSKQKDRIENFSKSTVEIDDEERKLIIRLLEGKIASPKV